MNYTFSNLVELLARKTGQDTSDTSFAEVLAIQTALPEKWFTAIKSGLEHLMTAEEAKTNDVLHQHFRKLTLNGVDAELKRLMNDFQLPAEAVTELESEKNSYTRLRKLTAYLHAANETAVQKAEELQQQINTLQTEITTVQEQKQQELQALQQHQEAEMLTFSIKHALQQKEYAGAAGNKKAQVLTALNLLTEELQNKQLHAVRDAEGTLHLLNEAKQPYTENNKEITYGDFVDRLLASHNMLKVSDPGANGNGGNIFKNKNTGTNRMDAQGLVSANLQQIELLEKHEAL